MKILVILCSFLLFVNCATFDDSFNEAQNYCDRAINSVARTRKAKAELYKRQEVICVAMMTNAKEQNRFAENAKKAGFIGGIVGLILGGVALLATLAGS